MKLDGIVLINKPAGISSNDLDYKVRKIFNTRKVGHLGTLDPFAEGLMVLGVNEGTKILPYLDSDTKSYEAVLKLGIETDTLDCTGNIISTKEVQKFDKEEIEKVLKSFVGEYDQLPPKYSSKSINGVRAYQLARDNIDFELKTKRVCILSIELLDFSEDTIKFKATVSKGTYIRSLGLDISKKLGTVGHLTYLRRDSIGEFSLTEKVKTIETLTVDDIVSLKNVLRDIPKYDLNDAEFKILKFGNPTKFKYLGDEVLFFYENNILFYSKFDHASKKYRVLRGFNYEYYKDK